MSFPGSRALSGVGFGGPSLQDQRLGARRNDFPHPSHDRTPAMPPHIRLYKRSLERERAEIRARAVDNCPHPDDRLCEVNADVYCCVCGGTF